MKKILRYIGLSVGILLACSGGAVLYFSQFYVVPIMTYHQIEATTNPKMDTVTPRSFEQQMSFLRKYKYNVISFEEYVSGARHGKSFPKNTVIIHFDDGYLNNYTEAFPILKKYNLPAMCFIVSDMVGQDLLFVDWKQVREMDSNGFHIGSHTRRHSYLPSLSHQDALDEIAGSKRIIEEKLGRPVDYFVYPSGGFSDSVKDIVISAGYKAAGTTNRGRDRLNKDMFELNRIRIKDSDHGFILWAKLSGYYNIFRSPR